MVPRKPKQFCHIEGCENPIKTRVAGLCHRHAYVLKVYGDPTKVPTGHTPESKAKIAEAQRRRYEDPEEREKTRASMLGRKITWGDKIAEANRGRKASEETRQKISDARRRSTDAKRKP